MILAVLALASLLARAILGLPAAFGVVGIVAIVALPLSLAFLVADAVPWRRNAVAASAVAAVGLPLALQPQWGWVAAALVLAAQVPAVAQPSVRANPHRGSEI